MQIFHLLLLTMLFINQLSGSDILDKLKKGNENFINGEVNCLKMTQKERAQMAKNQRPVAMVVTCSDSRVPPEIIFDQNPGDLFVIRIAGNVVDQLGIASIEYGISVLKIPLLIIMGHQNCGAISAAFDLGDTEFSANIAALLTQIKPSIRSVTQKYPNKSKAELLDLAIKQNVLHTHQEIINRSPIVREHLGNGTLNIVDAVFNIETGRVGIIDGRD